MPIDLRFAPIRPVVPLPAESLRDHLQTIAAWSVLATLDGVLAVAGFKRFYALLRRWPVLGSAPADQRLQIARSASAAVDRARLMYVRRAWCLQSAAVVVALLRLRGVDAQFVIGVRKMPFYAHAWAECDGTIVHSDPTMAAEYLEIARC